MKIKVIVNFTDKEIEKLFQSMVIICDTREQKNDHIIQYFKDKEINHKIEKLEVGDYSLMLPADPELGIIQDLYLTNKIVIERKNGLNELTGNFKGNDRKRLENEFIKARDTKIYLMIEDALYGDIINHKYRSKMKPQAFLGSLKAFEARYNLNTVFIEDKIYSGNFIYHTALYHLREYLKAS